MSFNKKDVCHFNFYNMTCHLYVIFKIIKMTKMYSMSFLKNDTIMTKYSKNDKQMTKMGVV